MHVLTETIHDGRPELWHAPLLRDYSIIKSSETNIIADLTSQVARQLFTCEPTLARSVDVCLRGVTWQVPSCCNTCHLSSSFMALGRILRVFILNSDLDECPTTR